MNAKLLTLMALLSLAALAAGYPTHDQRRENIDAMKLMNKIAMEQIFKQGIETPDREATSESCVYEYH